MYPWVLENRNGGGGSVKATELLCVCAKNEWLSLARLYCLNAAAGEELMLNACADSFQGCHLAIEKVKPALFGLFKNSFLENCL
jgi:hypothetical protein